MSLFSGWRGTKGGGDDYDDGPITAPGGWSNLLTWRPAQRPPLNDDQGSTYDERAGPSRIGMDDDEDDLLRHVRPEERMYTARTRVKGAPRARAPIPFQMDWDKPVSKQGRHVMTEHAPSSPSKAAAFTGSEAFSAAKGVDSADVSAELAAEMSADMSADLSMDASALDSAFETLTRIKAKDIAKATNRGPPSRMLVESPTSRKTSETFRTPNESPTADLQNTWMQWGTNKIRSTIPRALASALFSAVADPVATGARASIEEEDDSFDGDNENDVPAVVRDCIDVICGRGSAGLLQTEGLFRIPPSNALLRQVKDAYAHGERPNLHKLVIQDQHLPAALLKDHLRSMEPPIVQEEMYEGVMACPQDPDGAIAYLRNTLLPQLGQRRLVLLHEVMQCVHEVSKHSDANRMDAANLAVVLTPNLVHGTDVIRDMALCSVPKGDSRSDAREKVTLGTVVMLCTEHFDDVFDDLVPVTVRRTKQGSDSS